MRGPPVVATAASLSADHSCRAGSQLALRQKSRVERTASTTDDKQNQRAIGHVGRRDQRLSQALFLHDKGGGKRIVAEPRRKRILGDVGCKPKRHLDHHQHCATARRPSAACSHLAATAIARHDEHQHMARQARPRRPNAAARPREKRPATPPAAHAAAQRPAQVANRRARGRPCRAGKSLAGRAIQSAAQLATSATWRRPRPARYAKNSGPTQP